MVTATNMAMAMAIVITRMATMKRFSCLGGRGQLEETKLTKLFKLKNRIKKGRRGYSFSAFFDGFSDQIFFWCELPFRYTKSCS